MRLLELKTGQFRWVEDPRQFNYAILSHVWATQGDPDYVPEITFKGLSKLQAEARAEGLPGVPQDRLPEKLRCFCKMALEDGFEFGWSDTCCIDKESSSELSEAINSMFNWYAYSGACYAFLHDVKPPSEEREWRAGFSRSKWFKRGWTLQELLASRIVIFVCKPKDTDGRGSKWEVLGSKHTLASLVHSITKIDIQVLTMEKGVMEFPVARRMSWAQSRKTSKVEDEAYCLMGIFGVNLQPNYGEGRQAFIRLQQEILLQNPDQSIFAWGYFLEDSAKWLTFPSSHPDPSTTLTNDDQEGANDTFLPQYLLASSPTEFDAERCANICLFDSREAFSRKLGIPVDDDLYEVFQATQFGLRTQLPSSPLPAVHIPTPLHM